MNPITTLEADACEQAIENQATAILLLDGDLHVVYMNPAAEMLFEISVRKAARLSLAELMPGNEEVHQQLLASLRSGHPYTERERELFIPSGRHRMVDCSVTPLTGGKYRLLVELADVDRHLRISREEQLMIQHEATRSLVRGMAHEIKNPLGGLRGAAQLLEAELEDAELREYTGIIIREADRLRNLVNRMLGPNSLPHKTRLNIHEVLEQVRQLASMEAGAGIHIRTDYDPSIPELLADKDKLVQAILNIVGNAVQALDEEGEIILKTRIQRQFTIGNKRHKLVARIDVIDNGPGIDEAMQEKMFYPLVTSKADGTGLGLSIAQSLIAQHGGLIECESQPGHTVFTLLIPVEMADE